jgi:hypothetical protein
MALRPETNSVVLKIHHRLASKKQQRLKSM